MMMNENFKSSLACCKCNQIGFIKKIIGDNYFIVIIYFLKRG